MPIQRHAFVVVFALASVVSMAKWSDLKPAETMNYSFTLPLIHRDASNSPWHDSKLSHYDQIKSLIDRSIIRSELVLTSKLVPWHNPNLSDVISHTGEYFMNISIGTPSFPFLAVLDSCGRDSWIQCTLCEHCHEQNGHSFDPLKSSTFRSFELPDELISNKHQLYQFYSTNGYNNFEDTITIGSLKLPRLSVDCLSTSEETFNSIGFGVLSLIIDPPGAIYPRLKDSIAGKFSYCLTPLASNGSKSGNINFGENAIVLGDDVVSTTIVTDRVPKSVNLTLEAITVGEKRISWNTKPTVGNIIMDLGTTLLMLQSVFYDIVESEIHNQVNGTRVDDPSGQLKLCYNSDGFKPPKLVLNFKSANVTLNDFNAWIATSDSVVCFAAAPSDITIYGNLAQRNLLIGYDMKRSQLSFKSTDCSK